MLELRVGAAILKEAVELETDKQERLNRSKREEKAAAEAVANNVRFRRRCSKMADFNVTDALIR